MKTYLIGLCLFFFATARGLFPYENSTPSEIASIEPEPSTLICGCVHAITGNFLFEQSDMMVQGAQPIVIPRKYFSSSFEGPLEDQLVPNRRAFGWGLPHFIQITRFSIPEPNGMVFTYHQGPNDAFLPLGEIFRAGITGYCTDYLGRKYHPVNNRVYWPNYNTLLVQTSTGEMRVYERTKFTDSEPECQFEFRLCRLRLSNGLLIDYKYKKDKLKKILAVSPGKRRKTFSKIALFKEKNQLHLEGSDRSKLQYEYKNYKKKLRGRKRKINLLKCVIGTRYPFERLKREKKTIRIQERHFDQGRTLVCEYDKRGRVTKLSGPQGLLAKITYENGATTSIDRDGNKIQYEYDPNTLRIKKIHFFQGLDRLIKTENYGWTPFGCLEQKSICSAEGDTLLQIHCKYNNHLDLIEKKICKDQTYTFDYNERFLIKEEQEESGKRTTYEYFENTILPEEICQYKGRELLKKTTYRYNKDLLLIEEITEEGNYCFKKQIDRRGEKPFYGMPETISQFCGDHLIEKTKFTYDKWGNVTKEEHFGSDGVLAKVTETLFNEQGQIEKEIDAEKNATQFQYDSNGNLIWKKTPLGLEIQYEYDNANRLIEERQTGNGQTLITYYQDFDALDQPTKIIDPLGGITCRKYDALGNLIEEVSPYGYTITYAYDALGNQVARTDPLGNTTKTTYNHFGAPLTITYPNGSCETFTYNPDGTKASYTNAVGVTTLYSYDAYDNLCFEEILKVANKTWLYDASYLQQETNLDGYTTVYEYDPLGRKNKEIYEGRVTHYNYDSLSRIASKQIGTLRTEWTYDKLDRIISEKIYDREILIYQTHTTYNAEGSPLQVTNYPNNVPAVTQYKYDPFGRQIAHTTPLGRKTSTSYEIMEGKKIVSILEPGGICQIETYNLLDQLITEEKKDLQGKTFSSTEYVYDPCGNRTSQTINGHIIDWTYDNCNRKITETESRQKMTEYAYYPDGELKTLTKPDGTEIFYTYNSLGYLTSLCSSKGDIQYVYKYNNQGHLLLSKDLIHQTQTERIVDPHGNLTEETLANNLILKNSYDELGRRTQLTLPNKTIAYTHSGTNLASVTVDGQTHRYTYDQSGNLIQERHMDGSMTEYTYDVDGRLIYRKHPHLEETLQYDDRENLQSLTKNDEEFSYLYDTFDHLIEEPDHFYSYDGLHNRIEKDEKVIAYNTLNQEQELEYDPNGNLKYRGSYTFTYDSLDRLIKAQTWFTTTTYTYDSDHRRVFENEKPILWDGQHELGELNYYRILGRTPYAEIGSAVAACDQGALFQPLHTVTGDLWQLSDQTQTFTVFGEGNAALRWGYQSKVHDPTGLIYFGRRYYDPSTGRFITADPEGYIDSANLYAYTLNNPLTHHDPYGLYAYPPNLEMFPRYDEIPASHISKWREMGTGLYHASLAFGRDMALGSGYYLGGLHGLEDMSLADIYTSHLQVNDSLIKNTDSLMASSSYTGTGLYRFSRGVGYAGLDFSTGIVFPFAKVKNLASAGKSAYKFQKYARISTPLMKTRAVTSRLFLPNKNTQQITRGAENINASINLSKKLSQLEKVYTQGQELRILPDGRYRYYSKNIAASNPGITKGAKRVTEYNPLTGNVRTWHECYDRNGRVVRVHPKQINGQEVKSYHYPKTQAEIK